MVNTTLNAIRKHIPCEEGWEKLLKSLGKTKADDEPLPLVTILDSNGIDDAVWCLRALGEEHQRDIRLFACDIAEGVLYLFQKQCPDDKRPRQAIETARRYAMGKATKEELAGAWDAADAAARAVRVAAGDAEAAVEKKRQAQLFIK